MDCHNPLPFDLLELIFDLLDSSSDLLSLALTSSHLLGLIVPKHLHFRNISCEFQRPSLWHALAANPSATSRCHTLEILWGYHEEVKQRIPPHLHSKPSWKTKTKAKVDSCFKALALAIRAMPRLKYFTWRGERRPSAVIYDAILTSCPCLVHVDLWLIDELLDSRQASLIASLVNAPLRQLPNFTQFAFTYHAGSDAATSDANTKLLSAILLASAAIEDVYIKITGLDTGAVETNLLNLFRVAMWPYLRRLTILGISLHGAHEGFFPAHPRLENLYIRDNNQTRNDAVFAKLPGLKSLDLNYLPTPITRISPEVLHGLTHLSITWVDFDLVPTELQQILTMVPNLTSMVLAWVGYTPEWLPRIAVCVPGLEKLGIRWLHSNSAAELMREDLSSWRKTLSLLPKLTHLGTVELAAFSPPRDDDWKTQGWVTQGIGLEDRISAAVEQICSDATTTCLERIHFISDINGLNDIWVFLDPTSRRMVRFLVLPEPEESPEGLIPWSGYYFGGLESRLNPIGCSCIDISKLPMWRY